MGNQIALKQGEATLQFIESHKIDQADAADIFVTTGTIQYLEQDLDDIILSLSKRPQHIFINSLPAHSEQYFYTLQYLTACEVPYKIVSQKHLVESLQKLGYELVDQWRQERKLEIPFHLDLTLDCYSGFYFRERKELLV